MTLKSFPRGGKLVEKRPPTSLFQKHGKPSKKSRTKEKARKQNEEEAHFVSNTAERLTYATISEGLIVLGCIFEVTEYDLMVSLPGGIIGRVQITDICDSYTNLLQNLIKAEDSETNEFKPLPDLYSCGDYVVCYVKSTQSQGRWQIVLSLEPKLINQNVDINYIIDGSKIICTVTSIEDHGCVVDTGLPNVRAFIPTKEGSNEKRLFPGRQLLCCVQEIQTSENTSTIKLTPRPKYIKAIHDMEIKSLDSLMPGIKFDLYVKKILSNGLLVSFGDNHIGYVNQLYLSNPLAKYSVGLNITGTLLYILPTVKFGYFSSTIDKAKDNSIKPGDVLEEATVLFRESGGIVLQLTSSGTRGFLPLKRTSVDFQKVIEKFVPGSVHKCRILSYSWMDKTYVCTMQHSLMQERYFSLADFAPGDVSTVRITNINEQTGIVNVQIGKFSGQVSPEHVSDEGISALKKLRVDEEVEARVLAVNHMRNKVYFTLKRSLLTSDLPVLSNTKDAKPGAKYHGTIIKIHKAGMLVKFFGDVKGWIPASALDKDASDVNWNYSSGQTILVQIVSVEEDSGKITLSLPSKEGKQEATEKNGGFEIGDQVEGTIVESSTQGVYLRISKNDGQNVSTGFLPAGHIAPCAETAALLSSKLIPGERLTALVFATAPSLVLTRTFLPQGRYRAFETVKVGDCIPCSIRDLEPDGVRVILPLTGCSPFGYVSYSNVSNFDALQVNQCMFAKITSVNRKEKRLDLTLSLKKIYDGLSDPKSRMKVAVDTLALHFNKLAELASNSFYENKPISMVRLGQRVSGKIEKITDDGLVVKLQNRALGIVSKDHYSGEKNVGDKISGTVLWKNYVHEVVALTALPSVMHKISAKQNRQFQLPEKKLLRGRILLVTNWFVLILLKGSGKGMLAAMPTRRHMNDLRPDLTPYSVLSQIKCYVVLNSKESDIIPICMVKSAFEKKYCQQVQPAEKPVKDKKKVEGSSEGLAAKKKKQKAIVKVEITDCEEQDKEDAHNMEAEENDSKKERKRKKGNSEATVPKNKKQKAAKVEIMDCEGEQDNRDSKNIQIKQEEEVPKKESKRKKKGKVKKIESEVDVKPSVEDLRQEFKETEKKPRIAECGFFWDTKPDVTLLEKKDSSSDSEDETEQNSRQKKKKLSAAERREQERQKEREIRQREEALASNQLPNSVDQFDRLVLASPDSSIIWLQYMAYHLQTTEIEKARAVARRAVKTINFREETERLNVWNAWLNLESKFGTPETLNDVFQEAVRANDAIKIYTHMLTVHMDAGRQMEVEKTINTMTGKFKSNPQTWVDCGTVLLKMGLKEKSRHIMQRALQALPATEHVNLMARFAVLENKLGDKERAQTLFEQVLTSYPKRVDVWSCYVDSLVKSNDIDIARKVLERAVVQSLPPRKMKSLFKKFIDFEERHGTQEDVARVQKMAVEYVEKQCSKDV